MRHRIVLEGVVQGVGFRPFVKKLADRFGLNGITFNNSSGVIIEIDTHDPAEVRHFADAIRTQAPAAALIETCSIHEIPQDAAYTGFRIAPSAARDTTFTLISPDLATCPDCAAELYNPADRRFGYAFTNCTNCGPRYSITRSTPYDRANTTMALFPMCANCAAEYVDAEDRRFHAEPVACPVCGPRLSMPIAEAIALIASGKILGLKGLGGFQLACDARCALAVDELRLRKRRSRKPFAVMMRDLATVARFCQIDDAERALLTSPAAPVVLLPMRHDAVFPDGVAPGLRQIGVMLPYTPLHRLLFDGPVDCMVMTSGNMSEEPIVIHNDEAQTKLSPLADSILTHNRDIFMRVDDSVARVFEGIPRINRRARGYAPSAIRLAHEVPEVLAVGAELKNTFCITKGRYAIPSQHIGDLENLETLTFFEETLRNLESVYQANPRLIVHDLHPDYLGTRWALRQPGPKLAVQHHYAHIASSMAENGLTEKVIGVAFDGTGFGTDAQIWGGEFLVCDYHGFERSAHLRYAALPGGDRAAKQGWRMAASHLHDALGPDARKIGLPCWYAAPAASWKIVDHLIAKPTIYTSSCGRLFDAVSSITGISAESGYEGESAMLLEAAAQQSSAPDHYEMTIENDIIDTRPLIRAIASDMRAGRDANDIARAFHRSVAVMIERVCQHIREATRIDRVCLSGGTFQNQTLLADTLALLRASGFQPYLHAQVPPNDGGISLGQAVIGASWLAAQSARH